MIAFIDGSTGPIVGEVSVPGDKSVSHRAVMLASLAEGDSYVRGALMSEDVYSTINAMKIMGVNILLDDKGILIKGAGLHGLKEPQDVINAGNSGTTARLLAGLLAGQRFFSSITGDMYLRARPMGRVVDPLRAMGAKIWGRNGGENLPLAISGGGLRGVEYAPPQASAQVKTAILLAGLFAEGSTTVAEKNPTRDHTERMLRYLGGEVRCDGGSVGVTGGARLKGAEIVVPSDISSAAFFIVAAVVNHYSEILIKDVGLNPLRSGIIEVLRLMGASIEVLNERETGLEPVGDILVRSSDLKGIEIGGEIIPRLIDELPVLAVAACFAEGKTVIKDAAELRMKETDRISAMTEELRKLGADVEETADGMVIRGSARLIGARCSSWGDHRVAMALAVAATAAKGLTEIAGADCVSISYPGFFDTLERLR